MLVITDRLGRFDSRHGWRMSGQTALWDGASAGRSDAICTTEHTEKMGFTGVGFWFDMVRFGGEGGFGA